MEDNTSVYAIIGQTNYTTRLTKGLHSWTIDEPRKAGGSEQGPAPTDMLAGALSACMAITARMYADRKGWPMTSCQVKAHFEKDSGGDYCITTTTTVSGDDLTADQRKRLLDIANRCPIHKLLEKAMKITEAGPIPLEKPS